MHIYFQLYRPLVAPPCKYRRDASTHAAALCCLEQFFDSAVKRHIAPATVACFLANAGHEERRSTVSTRRVRQASDAGGLNGLKAVLVRSQGKVSDQGQRSCSQGTGVQLPMQKTKLRGHYRAPFG